MNERVTVILNFWFVEASPEDLFKRNEIFDQKIRSKFFTDYQKALENKCDDWQNLPESCLALIILLDQFSRNLFRDDKKAFDQDYKARLISNNAIARGYLEKLKISQKVFMLLPLLHSEDINDHDYVHSLCDTYLKDHFQFEMIKKIWNDHTKTIKKFGRYPHRNQILGRSSTKEEELFLQQPNSSW